MKTIDPELLRSVVESVVARLAEGPAPHPRPPASHPAVVAGRHPGGERGVFNCVEKAADAANDAHLKLKKLGVAGRAKVIEIVKTLAVSNAEAMGQVRDGGNQDRPPRSQDRQAADHQERPGTEWLQPYAMSGDGGITLEEYAPFGVIGAILPVTHSVPTLTGNVINMVAAGNSIVFNPHPGGARSAAMAVRAYNEAIFRESASTTSSPPSSSPPSNRSTPSARTR
jgi:aldehyde dehydrogenase